MNDLHKELAVVKDKWYYIGEAFEIECLDQFFELVNPLLEVIVHWIKRNKGVPPSWEKVVATLRNFEIDEAELADKIHRLYCERKDEERAKTADDQAYSGSYLCSEIPCPYLTTGCRKEIQYGGATIMTPPFLKESGCPLPTPSYYIAKKFF